MTISMANRVIRRAPQLLKPILTEAGPQGVHGGYHAGTNFGDQLTTRVMENRGRLYFDSFGQAMQYGLRRVWAPVGYSEKNWHRTSDDPVYVLKVSSDASPSRNCPNTEAGLHDHYYFPENRKAPVHVNAAWEINPALTPHYADIALKEMERLAQVSSAEKAMAFAQRTFLQAIRF